MSWRQAGGGSHPLPSAYNDFYIKSTRAWDPSRLKVQQLACRYLRPSLCSWPGTWVPLCVHVHGCVCVCAFVCARVCTHVRMHAHYRVSIHVCTTMIWSPGETERSSGGSRCSCTGPICITKKLASCIPLLVIRPIEPNALSESMSISCEMHEG